MGFKESKMAWIKLVLIACFLYIQSYVHGQSSFHTIQFDDYKTSLSCRYRISTITVDGNLEYRDVKKFDQNGRLVMEDTTRYLVIFGFHTSTKYKVNEKKRQISGRISFLPPLEPRIAPLKMTFDEDGKIAIWNLGTLFKEYHYDSSGNCTSVIETSGEDTIIRRFTLIYDKNGRLTHERGNSGSPIEYSYDENGRLIQEKLSTTTTRYLYDEQGTLEYEFRFDAADHDPFGLFDSRWTKIEYKRNDRGQLLEIHYYGGVQESPDEIVYKSMGVKKFSYELKTGSYEINIADPMQLMATQVIYTNRKPKKI